MVRLSKVVPPNCADIFVKLEWLSTDVYRSR